MMTKRIYGALLLLILIVQFIPVSPSQDISMVILSNVELVTVDDSYATVTWVTNIPEDTRVQWGETDQLDQENVVDVESEMERLFLAHLRAIEKCKEVTQ